jgi:hypothetical protein
MAFPNFAAGDKLTAADLNALVPRYYKQTSDQSLSTTTFTAHNTFASISVGANETWEVVCRLAATSAHADNDVKTDWAVTGSVGFDTYRHITAPGTSGTGAADTSAENAARERNSSTAHGVTTSATVLSSIVERFVVTGGGSGGTFTLRWAQSTAFSGSTTVLAGSHLIMRRIA